MVFVTRILASLAVLTLPSILPTYSDAGQFSFCEGEDVTVKAISLSGGRTATVDFLESGGGFDPIPLLITTVTVGGTRPSCLLANFSAMAAPQDNAMMFQVRVDGVPMFGHQEGYTHQPGDTYIPTPVVLTHDETGESLDRPVAYNFHALVSPGTHTVEVLFAGCCSTNPAVQSGLARAASLNLTYGEIPPELVAVDQPDLAGRALDLRVAPNPVRNMTTLSFEIASAGDVTVEIFDPQGRRVTGLVSGRFEAGRHTVSWDRKDTGGSAVEPGVYFGRLSGRDGSRITRVVVIQ